MNHYANEARQSHSKRSSRIPFTQSRETMSRVATRIARMQLERAHILPGTRNSVHNRWLDSTSLCCLEEFHNNAHFRLSHTHSTATLSKNVFWENTQLRK